MAQFVFARLKEVDAGGPTGNVTVGFIMELSWVGDELAGMDTIRVPGSRGDNLATMTTTIQNAIIARAAALGRPGLTTADMRLIGGSLW